MPNDNLPGMVDEKRKLWDWIMNMYASKGALTPEQLQEQINVAIRPLQEQHELSTEALDESMLRRGLFESGISVENQNRLDKRLEQGISGVSTQMTTQNMLAGNRNRLAGLQMLYNMWAQEYGSTAAMNMLRERLKNEGDDFWSSIWSGLGEGIGNVPLIFAGGG